MYVYVLYVCIYIYIYIYTHMRTHYVIHMCMCMDVFMQGLFRNTKRQSGVTHVHACTCAREVFGCRTLQKAATCCGCRVAGWAAGRQSRQMLLLSVWLAVVMCLHVRVLSCVLRAVQTDAVLTNVVDCRYVLVCSCSVYIYIYIYILPDPRQGLARPCKVPCKGLQGGVIKVAL